MQILDISVSLNPDLVTWEDERPPVVGLYSSIDKGDIGNVSYINMSVHSGTHIDAPSHFIKDGDGVDHIDLSVFYGPVVVVETNQKTITAELLDQFALTFHDRILFKTGSSHLYDLKRFSKDFTALSEDGARWLIGRQTRLVGIDYLSIEQADSVDYAVHKQLLSHHVVILEGLDLRGVPPGIYTLYALPLKISGTDGAPVRAVLTPYLVKN